MTNVEPETFHLTRTKVQYTISSDEGESSPFATERTADLYGEITDLVVQP